jgi:hypothetical protein
MVIFHSYVSLPEGNMGVRQASGTLPATTYKVVTPRSTSGFTPLSIQSDSNRYNQIKTCQPSRDFKQLSYGTLRHQLEVLGINPNQPMLLVATWGPKSFAGCGLKTHPKKWKII